MSAVRPCEPSRAAVAVVSLDILWERFVMPAKTLGRIVGALLLTAFFVYGGGSLLAQSVTGTAVALGDVVGSETRLAAGALLMLLNAGIVIGIGIAAYPVLERHHPVTAAGYLLTRGFEAALLAVGAVLVLSFLPLSEELSTTGDQSLLSAARVTQELSLYAYWAAMIGLSLGSLFFCRALFLSRLVPRPIAAWGFAGYALLATGGVLELLGHEVGLLLSAPGGLFEAAVGVLLLVKGFPEPAAPEVPPASVSEQSSVRSVVRL